MNEKALKFIKEKEEENKKKKNNVDNKNKYTKDKSSNKLITEDGTMSSFGFSNSYNK